MSSREKFLNHLRYPEHAVNFLTIMSVLAENNVSDADFIRALKDCTDAYDILPPTFEPTNYHKDLLQRLKDRDYAIEYLEATLEEGKMPEVFVLALRDVDEAHDIFDIHSQNE